MVASLRKRDIHVIYPSTNLVLACDRPNQAEDSPLSPIGLYGETKAAVEKSLIKDNGVTIARLPKILGTKGDILHNWKEKLGNGEEISAFSNLIVSPVSLPYAVNFLCKLMTGQPEGIWHISGKEEISYYQLARKLAEFISSAPDLVKPDTMPENLGAAPLHPSLSCEKTRQVFGIKRQSISELLTDCCKL